MKKLIVQSGSVVLNLLKKLDTSTDKEVYQEIYPPDSLNFHRFYNIGAGNFLHPFWTNVDNDNDYYSKIHPKKNYHIKHDLFEQKPMPVDNDSAELVYTSHTIEHVDDASVNYMLRDAYRILKPGGLIRIVTPDIDLSYSAMRRNDKKFFYWIDEEFVNNDFQNQCLNKPLSKASLIQVFLEEFAASASEIALHGADKRISDEEFEKIFREKSYEDALNYCTSFCTIEMQKRLPFRHMNWFNEKKLTAMVKEAGFKMVVRSGYLQSSAAVLRNPKYFDKTLPQLSLYIEAIK